jgi:hypothetical protein
MFSPAWRLAVAAFKKKAGRNVFGGTPNTARETHALPEIAVVAAVYDRRTLRVSISGGHRPPLQESCGHPTFNTQ